MVLHQLQEGVGGVAFLQGLGDDFRNIVDVHAQGFPTGVVETVREAFFYATVALVVADEVGQVDHLRQRPGTLLGLPGLMMVTDDLLNGFPGCATTWPAPNPLRRGKCPSEATPAPTSSRLLPAPCGLAPRFPGEISGTGPNSRCRAVGRRKRPSLCPSSLKSTLDMLMMTRVDKATVMQCCQNCWGDFPPNFP